MTDGKVKATIYMPEEVHRRLKIRAAEEGSSMTDLVLHAVEDLLRQSPSSRMSQPQTPDRERPR